MSKMSSHHGPACGCNKCAKMLAVARSLFARNRDTDLRDLTEDMRPFLLAVRTENMYHAWGKNTPGKAATKDDTSPWEENNIRGLEDFDDGAHQ